MAKDFKQEKQRVWARLQKKLGFYAPRELKKALDKRAGQTQDIEDYESLVEEYLSIAKSLAASRYFPDPKNPQNLSEKRYERPFQKRLYLVRFVIRQQISSKKQRNKIRKRINWEGTCKAWNEAHPNDPMTPKVLKSTFYRAIREDDLQREFKREMGVFTLEALWVGWLSQVLDDVDLIEKWAHLFSIREIFHLVMGKPLDDQQQELELEAVNNPYSVQERIRETARKGLALSHGIDLDHLKDLSDEELVEIAKSEKYKREVQNDE